MNHIRLLATGIVLMFALTVAAQTAPSGAEQNQSSGPSMSPVERHLKVLSEKLDLTSDQQDGVRPILQEMHDSMQKADQDASLSNDQRMDQVKTARMKADKQIREVLSDDQKKKLDQLEQGMHPELHGKWNRVQRSVFNGGIGIRPPVRLCFPPFASLRMGHPRLCRNREKAGPSAPCARRSG